MKHYDRFFPQRLLCGVNRRRADEEGNVLIWVMILSLINETNHAFISGKLTERLNFVAALAFGAALF